MRLSRNVIIGVAAGALVVVLAVVGTVMVLRGDQEVDPTVTAASGKYGQVSTGAVVETQEFDGTVVARWKATVKVNAVAGSDRIVVNRIVGKRDAVRVGQSLATISGRPLILLPGAAPGYRDLVEGDEGADVTELRTAMGRIGCTSTDAAGRFGPATAKCVRWMYERAGSQALTRTTGESADASPEPTVTAPAQDTGLVRVPWAELVFVPYDTVRVASRSASEGKILEPGTKLLTLSGGDLAVDVTTDGGTDATALTDVRQVTLIDSQGKEIGLGRPGAMNATGRVRISFGKKVNEKSLAELAQGDSVLVRVVVARSGQDELNVPIDALTTTAAGTAAVQVAGGDPVTIRAVPVTVSVIANGQAAVTPIEEGALVDGQRIALGS